PLFWETGTSGAPAGHMRRTQVTSTPLPDPRTEPVVPERFAGRTAIITGASRGIGLGIARRLLAEGASVVITARKQDGLHLSPAEEPFGPVVFVVDNCGIQPGFGRTIGVGLAAARKITEVNALGTLAWTQKVYHPGLGERGGAVVNVASIARLEPSPGIGWY